MAGGRAARGARARLPAALRRHRHVEQPRDESTVPRESLCPHRVAPPRGHRGGQRLLRRHAGAPGRARGPPRESARDRFRGEPRIPRRVQRRSGTGAGRVPGAAQQRHRGHAGMGLGAHRAPGARPEARARRPRHQRHRQRGPDRRRIRKPGRAARLGARLGARSRRRGVRDPDARVLLRRDAPRGLRKGRPARRAFRDRDVRGRRLQPSRPRRRMGSPLRPRRVRPSLAEGLVPPARQGSVLPAVRGEPEEVRGEMEARVSGGRPSPQPDNAALRTTFPTAAGLPPLVGSRREREQKATAAARRRPGSRARG